MKRIVYRITYTRRHTWWRVRSAARELYCYNTQREAVLVAVGAARADLKTGRLAQVVLHGKDGRIRWERTYGRDPKRRKG